MGIIKEYRQAAGLTQKQFSELFKIPIDVVKSWDSGRRNPPEWAEKLIIEKLESMKIDM
ncbi:MAG: transcriptional regulator [Lachnospiraceae bacterium]|nr:transcriptional regulator [Lachnospiraceae bacterium]